jgi:Ser/Thr protein kinase RdoA (MazF antagonist)
MREADQDLSRWEEMLARYAELQIDAAQARDELLAHSVPDRRLAVFPELYEEMLGDPVARGDGLPEALTADELRHLHERSPDVQAMCDQLAALGVPETIQHDDLHDANVFLRDGRFVFFDWGDSCVSHPFLTMTVTLHGVLAWLLDPETGRGDVSRFRDAYLEPFTRFAPREQLLAAFPAAIDLGVVCRGLSWLHAIRGLEPPHRDEWASSPAQRLRWFLEPA